ncbi:MAG: hypothetical protein RR062_05960 [Clostridia bacterium]
MNILLLALAFLFLNKKGGGFNMPDLNLFNDNTNNVLSSFSKATSGKLNLTTILELLSNPIVLKVLGGILGSKFGGFDGGSKDEDKQSATKEEKVKEKPISPTSKSQNSQENEVRIEKDQPFASEDFTQESKDFFAPVKDIAGVQVSQELYKLYDNWYIK